MVAFHVGDNLEILRSMESDSVDLVMTSPPYEAARTYGIDFNLRGQDWVDWCVERFIECVRVCKGLVVWVVEGQTRNFRWSAAPAMLMADLHRAGVHLRKPPAFFRVGIPGSGGPDYFRNDYEFCVVGSKGGKLPWSDATACGHPPKWAPGGEMSYRLANGTKVNQWGSRGAGRTNRRKDGTMEAARPKPSHKTLTIGKTHTKSKADGTDAIQTYHPPSLANPGNVIRCKVGGCLLGSKLAHENEAPFPESLAERFVLSFCPPGGVVLDPFCGSGTTLAVAIKNHREAIGIDVRESQIDLSKRRVKELQLSLL